MAHFIPCKESHTASELANLFVTNVWKLHGFPKSTISDRGTTFNSKLMKAIYERIGTSPSFSTAYHPQTDGVTERINQWMEGWLRSFANYWQDDWADLLPIAEFSYNLQKHRVTGSSPFAIVYGREPLWNISSEETTVPEANTITEKWRSTHDEVIASMINQRLAEEEPKNKYQEGDLVWLLGRNIQTKRPSKKLDNKKHGPFVVKRKIGSHTYELTLPATMRVHPVFHIDLLSPYIEDTEFKRNQPQPLPIITEEGEEEYEVEKILDWKETKDGLFYRVRWKGYGDEEDTEQKAEDFGHLSKIIKDFLRRHPNAPTPSNYVPGKIKGRGEQLVVISAKLATT
jgi:hypothetical protein